LTGKYTNIINDAQHIDHGLLQNNIKKTPSSGKPGIIFLTCIWTAKGSVFWGQDMELTKIPVGT
jgi:hypothetical protein